MEREHRLQAPRSCRAVVEPCSVHVADAQGLVDVGDRAGVCDVGAGRGMSEAWSSTLQERNASVDKWRHCTHKQEFCIQKRKQCIH
eukprot:669334-Rhodomonas_salina.2